MSAYLQKVHCDSQLGRMMPKSLAMGLATVHEWHGLNICMFSMERPYKAGTTTPTYVPFIAEENGPGINTMSEWCASELVDLDTLPAVCQYNQCTHKKTVYGTLHELW